MTETKISLAGTKEIEQGAVYLVDFSKLNSVNDLILILSAMAIAFPSDHPHIEVIKPFLNLDNPIKQQPKPQQAGLNLPKLKQL